MRKTLVVDDDEYFRGLVCKMLRFADHEVLAAADGRAALNLSRRQRVDLAIIGMIMPETDGIETIIELRRHQPGLSIVADLPEIPIALFRDAGSSPGRRLGGNGFRR